MMCFERQLSRLERSGLVAVESIGNQKHYRAETELHRFSRNCTASVAKTVGVAEPIKEFLYA